MSDAVHSALSRMPRPVRLLAIATAALAVLWGLTWLAVPPLAKSQIEQRLSALLGREVSIGRIVFAPWSLTLAIEKVRVGAGPGNNNAPQITIDRVVVNADSRSLLHLAPVVEALDIEGPRLRLTRLADGHYDIDDLLARFATARPPPAPGDEPARFALHNLRLVGGGVDFDDQPVQRMHRLQALQLSLPFLSNLPSDVAVTVEPRLAFTLDGAAFDSGAQAKPFAQDHASQFEVKVVGLDLAPWLPYLPASLPMRPARGILAATLQVQFALPQGGAPRASISGQATLSDFALVASAGAAQPLAAWQRLQIALVDVQPLLRRVNLGAVTLAGPRFDLRRAADGHLNFLPAATGAPAKAVASRPGAGSSAAAAAPAAVDDAWRVAVERLVVSGASVDWHDATTRQAAALRVDGLDVAIDKLRWPFDAAVPLKLSGRALAVSDVAPARAARAAAPMPASTFSVQGEASNHAAKVAIDVQAFDLRLVAPYVAQTLTPTIDGRVTLAALVDWAGGEHERLTLSQLKANVQGLRMADAGAAQRADALSLTTVELADTSIDLLAHHVALGILKVERPALHVNRDREGRWGMASWLRAAPAGADKDGNAQPWHIDIGEAQIADGELRVNDKRPADSSNASATYAATGIQASLRGIAWPGAALARTQLQFRLAGDVADSKGVRGATASPGRIEWNGQLALAPLQARGILQMARVPLHLFEPYFGGGLNLVLLRAEAGWRGNVMLAQRRGGGFEASARGDALLGDVHVHERVAGDAPGLSVAGDELLSWQSLVLRGLQFTMKPGSKPRLSIADAALTDLYSRLVITEQGRFNLRNVATAAPATQATQAPNASPAATSAASAPAPTASELPIDIAVAATRLVNGKVDFSDHFVRPNYSAALTELNGSLGAFDSANRDMAVLSLRGRAAGTALLEVSGSLNPTVQPLALDIRAKATDLELAPLSPYSGRYAGYAIERGKLSMDVAYKIEPDGKLDAKNQVVLNQLTFGDKVDSPDATKLPVLLVVALLKDRNGVIDINLPVSGSINDPQFSVFGIVLKIIGNLLVKALTAPFALLSGGGSDDLSFVHFEPGTAALTEGSRATIDKVAKALADRPALQMTVAGSSDPVSEHDAIQKAALDARVFDERRREALRAGGAGDAALPALTPGQREALLRRVYGDTKLPNKPRNLIGLAKDIPVAEMEALLRQATPVTTDIARELALQRGLTVRDALIAKGLPSERLFVAAPKLRASGQEDAAWTPRVQLLLSTH